MNYGRTRPADNYNTCVHIHDTLNNLLVTSPVCERNCMIVYSTIFLCVTEQKDIAWTCVCAWCEEYFYLQKLLETIATFCIYLYYLVV